MGDSGTVSRWTRRFTVGSAISMIMLQAVFLFDASYRVVTIVGLFGAVLPMVFGMAYLLVPSYVGRTLATNRLPGVHFTVAYVGTGLFASHELFELDGVILTVGIILWGIGVALFIGSLLWSIAPAVRTPQKPVGLSGTQSRRTRQLAKMAIPVAVVYLVIGTVALLSIGLDVPMPVNASLPIVVHFYATGFVALLIFALGIHLMAGFFEVSVPEPLAYLLLFSGGIAPGVLAIHFYHPPWFIVGAGLEFIAMLTYGSIVAVVVTRTDRRRVGIYGIGFGALAGVVSVGVAFGILVGFSKYSTFDIHVVGVLNGFLLLTIIGYAYQFFPVTNSQCWGATDRFAATTIFLLGTGTGVRLLSIGVETSWLRTMGVGLALFGIIGYAYLMIQRFR